MVGAVEGDGEGGARAAGGGFEARIRSDHVIGEDAAVAPAAHAKTVGIGHAFGDHAVDAGLQIFHFIMPPIGGDGSLVFGAAAVAAAIIHAQDGIAVSSELLRFEVEACASWPLGPP